MRDFGRRGGQTSGMVYKKPGPSSPPGAVKRESSGSAAAGQVEGTLNRALIEEALTRLDTEHREVLVALYYRRVPVNDLARQLNIPTGTVNTRALSALRAVHSFLKESRQP